VDRGQHTAVIVLSDVALPPAGEMLDTLYGQLRRCRPRCNGRSRAIDQRTSAQGLVNGRRGGESEHGEGAAGTHRFGEARQPGLQGHVVHIATAVTAS
jgi:hypothetical protein